MIKPLGTFQGGGNIVDIAIVLGIKKKDRDIVVRRLIHLKLAEPVAYGFLRFHPALCHRLWAKMSVTEQRKYTGRWSERMLKLSEYLYAQHYRDKELCATLTNLELPNLIYLLHLLRAQNNLERNPALVKRLEVLFAFLDRHDLVGVVKKAPANKKATPVTWDHHHFSSYRRQVELLLKNGNIPQALKEARKLLEMCLLNGEGAYDHALRDTASAYYWLGRILKVAGSWEEALEQFREAYQHYNRLAKAGEMEIFSFVASAIHQITDCLYYLDRFSEAEAIGKERIERAEVLNNEYEIAQGKRQLGMGYRMQKRFKEAVKFHRDALAYFEKVGESAPLAEIHHQLGMDYEAGGRYSQAEKAYKQSIAVNTSINRPVHEADTLIQLGHLYQRMGQLDHAVDVLKQASAKGVEMEDLAREGVARSNIAEVSIKLKRFKEAREEIQRAIYCDQHFGHAAEPWKTWMIMQMLEQVQGNHQAARQARRKAFELFLAYRNDGGENYQFGGRLCAAFKQAVQQNNVNKIKNVLDKLLRDTGLEAANYVLIKKLQTLLKGKEYVHVWDDDDLDYDDAVELYLLVNSSLSNRYCKDRAFVYNPPKKQETFSSISTVGPRRGTVSFQDAAGNGKSVRDLCNQL
jgi:tetratricopeptide (TPR) repeat protein